jgi:hypothetical protein
LRHPYFLLGGDQAAAVLSKFSFSTKWDADNFLVYLDWLI